MPDTPEHRADMHALARERRAQGLPEWEDGEVYLGDFWHNDDVPFEEKRDRFVQRVKDSGWLKRGDQADELECLLDEIGDTETVSDFDWVFSAIYNIADYDRVWFETHVRHDRPEGAPNAQP
jgi:hypothetical protein